MTIAEQLAGFAADLRLDRVPDDTVRAATWYLADTLACALAAAREPDADAVDIVIRHASAHRALPEATVVGTDWKTSLGAAALANCTMARYIDANDIYMPVAGSLSGAGHFSDALPALLAAAESVEASGVDLIEAVIIAYESQAALADALPWLDIGLHSVSQVTIAVALAAGRLLGVDREQLAHASSLAVTTGLILNTWLHPESKVPAIKGGAPGFAAERGITCARLAASGFTGPLDAFETFFERHNVQSTGYTEPFERLGREWMTPRNAIKPVPAQIYIQAVVQCARQMYGEGLRLADLKQLTVYSNPGACARVQGSPGAFRPASREAADHSTPFVTAMVLRDGDITPSTYAGSPWTSNEILEAMTRMSLVVDEEWTTRMRESGLLGAEIVAESIDGRRYAARVEQFRGHPDNPLSREELVVKINGCIGEARNASRGAELLELCESLASGGNIDPLIGFWRSPPVRAQYKVTQAATSSE